jgi:hypothetical protein
MKIKMARSVLPQDRLAIKMRDFIPFQLIEHIKMILEQFTSLFLIVLIVGAIVYFLIGIINVVSFLFKCFLATLFLYLFLTCGKCFLNLYYICVTSLLHANYLFVHKSLCNVNFM